MNTNFYTDENILQLVKKEYIDNNKSMTEVAQILGVSYRKFHRYLNKNKLTKNLGDQTYKNREWLYQKYIIENLSIGEIVNLCVLTSGSSVCYWLKKNNISIKPRDRRQKFKLKYTNEDLKHYRIYRFHVRRLSDKNYRLYKNIVDPENLGRTRQSHLDHIYPIAKGFENNIQPEIISSPVNLRIISGKLNQQKYSHEEITVETLLNQYNYFMKEVNFYGRPNQYS